MVRSTSETPEFDNSSRNTGSAQGKRRVEKMKASQSRLVREVRSPALPRTLLNQRLVWLAERLGWGTVELKVKPADLLKTLPQSAIKIRGALHVGKLA